MAHDDASDPQDVPEDAAGRPQDPLVDRLRPDSSQPPERGMTLAGFLGDSDRPGFRRLYFTRDLSAYAEFRGEDVLAVVSIPADQPPFLGEDATRVTVRHGAMVEYTQSRTAMAADEFDLDVRLAAPPSVRADAPNTFVATCWQTCPLGCIEVDPGTGDTCFCGRDTVQITICRGRTCVDVCTQATCRTDCGQTCDTCANTCDTCWTQCGQPTCAGTCQTCNTQCNQATCQTCNTQCGQATCRTCATDCGRCMTDNPHVFTCGGGPRCF